MDRAAEGWLHPVVIQKLSSRQDSFYPDGDMAIRTQIEMERRRSKLKRVLGHARREVK